MHWLKSIEIANFRGQEKKIRLNLSREANFLIGRNGTGKTTLINLIKAAISIDLEVLEKIEFTSIVLKLKRDRSAKIATITILKEYTEQLRTISYIYAPDSSSSPETHVLFRRELRRVRLGNSNRLASRFVPVDPSTLTVARVPISARLSRMINQTWLSLQRRDVDRSELDEWEMDDDERQKSDVDLRLVQVFGNLRNYFFRLDAQVSGQITEFQRRWFLSFLSAKSRSEVSAINKIDVDDEREALTAIFRSFDMKKDDFSSELEEYLYRFSTIRSQQNDKNVPDFNEVATLTDALKLHYLVDEWQELQTKREELLSPKTDFANICTGLLFRKSLNIGPSNEVGVSAPDNTTVPINELSSGEKQILIFLSETMLQERHTHIFMADEPELSLHVEWQIGLVENILEINPKAQVIFATHSPDIVGQFQENVFKMEEIIG